MSMQVFLKVRGNTGSLTETNNRSLTAELIYQCVIFLYLLQHLIAVQSWPDAGWFSAGQRCPVLIHVLHQDQRPLGWSHCQSVWGLTQKNSYRCTMSPAGRWCWCQRRLTGGWTWLKQCQLWPREHPHGSWGVSLLHLGDDGHVHTTLSEPYEGKHATGGTGFILLSHPKQWVQRGGRGGGAGWGGGQAATSTSCSRSRSQSWSLIHLHGSLRKKTFFCQACIFSPKTVGQLNWMRYRRIKYDASN